MEICHVFTLLSHFLAGDTHSPPVIEAASALGAQWLRSQGLAPLIWHAWQHVPLTDVSPDLVSDLRAAYYAAVGDAELHQRELVAVLRALDPHAITPAVVKPSVKSQPEGLTIVFKGAALAYTIYPDPVCRPMGDIDLWLTDEEMPRAQAALEQIGYVQSIKAERPLALMQQHNGEVQLHSVEPGRGLVELHWGIFAGEWVRRTAAIDQAGIRARVVPARLAGEPALTLAPEDGLIQLAVHMAVNHQLGMAALRGLVDVTYLARAKQVDWDVVAQRAQTWRVGTATWLVLKLAIDLTGLTEATPAVKRLSPSRLRGWLLGRFANAHTVVEMRDLRNGLLRYVFLLLLVDRFRDAARLVFRTLWPEQEWLAARYGNAGSRTRLRHLVNALRGSV